MEILVLSLSFVQIKLSIFALLFDTANLLVLPPSRGYLTLNKLNIASQIHDSNVLLVLCIRHVVVSYAALHKVL
jgi:hypothetical protein